MAMWGGVLNKVEYPGLESGIIVLLEAASNVAVNVFLLIFGYFQSGSNRFDIRKVLILYDVVFYQILFYVIDLIFRRAQFSVVYAVSRFLPINYYIVLYVGVYLLSPYINMVLERLDYKKTVRFCAIIVFVISLEPYFVDIIEAITHFSASGLSFIGIDGDQHGYTLLNFMLMYIIGATLRKANETTNLLEKKWGLIYAVGTVLIGFFEYIYLWKHGQANIIFNYNSPLVILNSVAFFELFEKIDIGKNSIINRLAKASLTVYLTHAYILGIIIWITDSRIKVSNFVLPEMILPVFVYLIAFIVYLLTRGVIDKIKDWIMFHIHAIEEKMATSQSDNISE